MRGTRLGDRYRLDEWLGGGSMGDVWLAEDEVLSRRVAVKILKPGLLDEPGFAERFHDEARVMARLRHPGIVGVHDFGPGRPDGGPSWATDGERTGRPIAYLVMELIDGEPLSDVLERRGRLAVPVALELALQVLAALQAAHEAGVVHRDIKPANLMVRDEQVVIADFGIARPGCDARLTVPGMVLGTAAYQAPEQASTGTVTASADLYALGVVLYECLAGQLPFAGETALEVILKHLTEPAPPLPADVPGPVRALVERAMAKDPQERWPDAAAMAAVARAALDGEPVEGPATDPATDGSAGTAVVSGAAEVSHRLAAKWRAVFGGRRRTLLAAGVVALCCAVTAAAAASLHPYRDRAAATADGGPAAGGSAARGPAVGGSAARGSATPSPVPAVPLSAPVGSAPGPGVPSLPGQVISPSAPTSPSPGSGLSSSPDPSASAKSPAPAAPGIPVGPGPASGTRIGAVDVLGARSTDPNAPARPSAAAPAATTPPPVAPGASPAPVAPSETPSPSVGPVHTAAPPPPSYVTDGNPPTNPPTPPVGPLPALARITNGGNALYDQASLNQDGSRVVLSRDDGSPATVWRLTPFQGSGYFLFNGATQYARVLDLDETQAQAQLWRSPPYSSNQIWSFVPVAGGYLIVITKDPQRCLSAAGPNVPAVIRSCSGTPDQVWTVTAA